MEERKMKFRLFTLALVLSMLIPWTSVFAQEEKVAVKIYYKALCDRSSVEELKGFFDETD